MREPARGTQRTTAAQRAPRESPIESLARPLTNGPIKGTKVSMKGTYLTPSALGSQLLGKTRLAVLALLLPQPERKLHLRQILRLAGAGQGGVQRELAKLVAAGVLIKTREANLTNYHANVHCPVFDDLKGLVEKTAGIAGSVREALLPLGDRIERAFIYGSVAKGAEQADSDIDLMVIGDVSFFEVVSRVSPLQESLGREINPTVFTPVEVRERLNQNDRFLTQVMREKKTPLIGGDDES